MSIIKEISENEYKAFFKACPYNHFLQSYEWGPVAAERKQTPYYLGLVSEDGTIKAACLALKKNVPLIKKSYFYSPRGVLIDYSNFDLIDEFTVELKNYLKKQKAIYFKMDPAIIYEDIDKEANPIPDGNNNYELFNHLIKLGYHHHGFTKLFELNQPRYTFRIDTTKPFEEIEKNMNKSFLKKVRKSYYYEMEITHEYDNDKFYELMTSIANKDNFSGNSKKMHAKLDEIFSKSNMIEYFTIKIYPDKILKKVRKELDELKKDIDSNNISQAKLNDAKEKIPRLEKDIEKFTPYEGKYPEGIVSLVQVCPKTDKGMWMVYIGNNDLATYTFAVNRDYYEAVKYACENKKEFLDLFGTVGLPHTKEKNYAGIHEYKSNLGGIYTEFIGEFDLVNNHFWYKVLPIIIGCYRKIKKITHR